MKPGCEGNEVKPQRSIELPVLAGAPPVAAMTVRSRTSRWRALSLVLLSLLMVAHYVQWQIMGRTISPIEPSETMFTLQRGAVNAGFIFFILAILSTMIFGRYVCGWGCHIVALQDFCAWLLGSIGLKPRPFRSRLLVYVPLLAALYMFVWPTAYRFFAKAPSEPLFPQFTNHLITTEFWATFPSVAVAIPFLFICGFVTVYFLGSKGFCTYACPYGGVFSVADKVAPGKIRVTDACNQCGICTATCMANVQVHTEIKEYGMVVDPGCMKHMDCISVCPNDALYFGFGKPSLAAGPSKAVTKTYSLTWPEEILAAAVFLASLLAVWDVYQLVPMLMALGTAAVTTYLVLRVVRIIRSQDLSFYRYSLRSSGKIRIAGWLFIAFAALWTGLNIHTGWVRYHEWAGSAAYQDLQIPDELALAQADPDQWLSPSDRKHVAEGKTHLRSASEYGLFTNTYALPKLAWFEYLSANTDAAIQLLTKASEHQDGEAKALSLYYMGTILNRLGRYEEAQNALRGALTERDDLVLARVESGESLWQLGRRQEAIKAWSESVARSPGLAIANYELAGAAAAAGNSNEAADFERRAEQSTPNDPYFHWVIALRLQNIGMSELAEKHFARAIQIDPRFRVRRKQS